MSIRIIFGVLSLLVVLSIVGTVGRKQVQAEQRYVTTRTSKAAIQAGIEIDNMQQQIRNDTIRARQQGDTRNGRGAL